MKIAPVIYRPSSMVDRIRFLMHCKECNIAVAKESDYLVTYSAWNDYRHDCGSNIELAKALSALDDDNDYMQWMVSLTGWDLCDDYLAEKYPHNWHKATQHEIIEKFKDK